ncbi:hypothetical protein BV898_09575 [Hypsibius exemplaris]|uniref:Uncharacterized protein n=1 Tax=Hypsibius exemplaris TaxID=2072580 RepID=A0A1W0WM82_HYPEX|nr:hypothetical protein BV898_09575 [Hypsibius exemplaris]
MKAWMNCVMFLVSLVLVGAVMGQKRSAVQDLEMLVSEPIFANPEIYRRTGSFEKFVDLSDTLKRLQELQKYYHHQGRTRYGRSIPEASPSEFAAINPQIDLQTLLRQRRAAMA